MNRATPSQGFVGVTLPSSVDLAGTVGAAFSSSTGSALLSGGVAGCVAKTVVSPLSRLTVLAQTASLRERGAQPRSVLAEATRIAEREGFRAFWRGNVCTCLHRFPLTGLQFSIFDVCQRQGANALCSGALASAIAVTCCYPLDIIRTRLMTQTPGKTQPRGVVAVFRELRANGRAGIYRGIVPSIAVALPPVAISFATYTPAKKWLMARGFSEKSPAVFVLGGFSGIIGSSVVFPLDLLRRRLQIIDREPPAALKAAVARRSLREAVLARPVVRQAMHVIESEGCRGLWRGLGPELMKVFPSAGIMFLVFEQLKALPNVFREPTDDD